MVRSVAAVFSMRFRDLGVAASILIVLLSMGCSKAQAPLNVVVFTLDTVRADALGCYGNDRIETPVIDRLAAEGVLFGHAETAVPITLPSHTTILTGRYPMGHGVRDNGFFVVPPEERTLAEILADHGYRTAAAVGAFPVIARFGLDQGFEFFDDDVSPSNEDDLGRLRVAAPKIYFDARRAARVNDAVRPWLENHSGEPFFVWLHYYDAHHPLAPPPPFNHLYAEEPYFGEIAYIDACIGRFLENLEDLGVADRTIVVITADHGEGRGDHNEDTHSLLAYEATVHVPLIVHLPGGVRPGIIDRRVGTVDIVPTVLDLLGIPSEPGIQGRSLKPMLDGAAPDSEPEYYTETLSPRLSQDWGELRALYRGKFKYIHGPRPELFDLEADPGEIDDLIGGMPGRAAEMRSALQGFMTAHADHRGAARTTVDADTRARLEALGYVDAGGDTSEIVEVLRDGGIPPQDRVQDVNLWTRTKDALTHDRPAEARESVMSLLRQNPENPVYREALVTALLQLGLIDEALENLQSIRQIDVGGTVHPTPQTLMMAASALARSGRVDEGLDLAAECERLHPSAPVLYLERQLLLELGRIDEAERVLDRALELDPDHVPSRVARAAEIAQAGDPEKARSMLEAVISDRPFYAPAHYNLGVVALNDRGLEPALTHFERAVELDPFYLKSRYAVIAVLLDLGRTDDAGKRLERLESLASKSPETLRARDLVEAYR